MAPCPSPPAKVNKMPIRVSPLVYSLCGAYSSSKADELESICWVDDWELMKEWVTHLAKTT
jgi:hypothetical protein